MVLQHRFSAFGLGVRIALAGVRLGRRRVTGGAAGSAKPYPASANRRSVGSGRCGFLVCFPFRRIERDGAAGCRVGCGSGCCGSCSPIGGYAGLRSGRRGFNSRWRLFFVFARVRFGMRFAGFFVVFVLSCFRFCDFFYFFATFLLLG